MKRDTVCERLLYLGGHVRSLPLTKQIAARRTACNLCPYEIAPGEIFWQVISESGRQTITICTCHIPYSNVGHQFSLTNFEDYSYSEHIKHEPLSFQIAQKVGTGSLVLLSVLLKDRYFPKEWKQIIERLIENENSNALATSSAHS